KTSSASGSPSSGRPRSRSGGAPTTRIAMPDLNWSFPARSTPGLSCPHMARVFVSNRLPGTALDRLAAAHDAEVWPARTSPPRQELLRHTTNAEGLISMLTDRIDAELIGPCPRLLAISNYAVGVDNVDLAAAT